MIQATNTTPPVSGRHVLETRQSGSKVLLRKFGLLLILPLTLPAVVLIRLIRPLVAIRLGCLGGDRLGHHAFDTEAYLCERDRGAYGSRTLEFFYYVTPVANQQLKKMWGRTLRVSRLARLLVPANRWLPGKEHHTIDVSVYEHMDVHGLMAHTSPHLSFTPEEVEMGRQELQNIGIPDGTPFVCFHARDKTYLEESFPGRPTGGLDFRNGNIHDYVPAAQEMAIRGYFAVRMGAIVNDALRTTGPGIIDYARKFRTDFLDIYLAARCRFFLATGSGIDSVAHIFRRPVAYVNYPRLGLLHYWSTDHLFILKKLWLRREQRYMTFPEILGSEVREFGMSHQFDQFGVDLEDNTPEETTALAIEMDERLEGTWETTEEDEQLQRRFWSLFDPGDFRAPVLARIGAEFLRQNRDLLD